MNKGARILFWNKGNAAFWNKKDEIEIIINNHNPMCFGVLEANVEHDYHPPSLAIDGYKVELDNLWSGGKKGRAMVYVKDEADYIRRKDLEPPLSPAIWLEFEPGTQKAWLLFIGYREWRSLNSKDKKHSGSDQQQTERLATWEEPWNRAENEGKTMILAGDFNIDAGPWINPEIPLREYQSSKKKLLQNMQNICSSLNLDLFKTAPTRVQGKCKASTLDWVLSNKINLISNHEMFNSSTDHKIISFFRTGKEVTEKVNIVTARSYKNYSKDKMLSSLNIPAINRLLWSTSADYVADQLVTEINLALDLTAPFKKIQLRNNYAPSLSPQTKILMGIRNDAKAKYSKSKCELDKINYNKIRNEVLKIQRKEKKEWVCKMLHNNGNEARRIWRTVKIVSGDNKKKTISN